MKIDDSLKKPSGLATGQLDPKAAKSSESSKASSTPVEKVTFSSMSSQLQALETKVAAADSFEVKKVEAIKSAILDGQFTINSDKVADGLISTVKELLATQKT